MKSADALTFRRRKIPEISNRRISIREGMQSYIMRGNYEIK